MKMDTIPSMLGKWSQHDKSNVPHHKDYKVGRVTEEEMLYQFDGEEDKYGDSLKENSFFQHQRSQKRLWWLTVINFAILCGALFTGRYYLSGLKRYKTDSCIQETSYYSPILENAQIALTNVLVNGTLWPGEHPSWTRSPPKDEEAKNFWERFEAVDTFPITRQQVISLGKDPETVAKYPNDYWGMGEDAYIASLDIQHKVHCLNELRTMAFVEYGLTGDFKPVRQHSKLWWIHLRHCVDILAQDLLCHADADLVTYNWRDTQAHPFPDFSVNRKCRSVDPLFAYRDKNRVDQAKYTAMTKPTHNINQLPFEPGYYALFGFADSDLYPEGDGYTQDLPDPDQWFGKKPDLAYLNSAEYKEKHGLGK